MVTADGMTTTSLSASLGVNNIAGLASDLVPRHNNGYIVSYVDSHVALNTICPLLDATTQLITFGLPGSVPWSSTPFANDPNVLTSLKT